ncbi:MAG: alpha-L-fucosidase [Candidatus Brocadiia bacterium]
MAKEKPSEADRLAWWREARFGMFIHWGLYAIPAGTWKGRRIGGIGEWIMHRARIPVAEYERLAARFDPLKFDADQWARTAKNAGMRYMVVTAKHHDGFAMFDSPSSDYDIVDATPYGRDPMADLARACRKHGLKLCFYYSQSQDWHDPDAAGNTWDFADEGKKDFAAYLRRKARPQVRELLTRYGPVGLIWFDTPRAITRSQSLGLKRLVHSLQPQCLVSGRVGHGVGDYGSMGDNEIPAGPVEGDWETPATMNDTWGYKSTDHNWKSPKTLLTLLVDLASKGANYLLNVGPTAEGLFPRPSLDRLREVGKWMRANGQAIYGSSPSPFPYEHDWGRITAKAGKLYLFFTQWPRGPFTLYGLRTPVSRARLLGERGRRIQVRQDADPGLGLHVLHLELPRKKPGKHIAVVELTLDGEPQVDSEPIQQPDGAVTLPAHMACLHVPKTGRQMRLGRAGTTENWLNKRNWLSWDFKVFHPATFEARVHTVARGTKWQGGHRVKVAVGGRTLGRTLRADEHVDSPRAKHAPEAATKLGTVRLSRPGVYSLKLRAEHIRPDLPRGLCVSEVRLVPAT